MDKDQVNGSEPTESDVETPTEDNQEGLDDSLQSNEGDVEESPKLKLKDGRELTAEEVLAEYQEKLLPEFTKKSQRLSELEKELEKMKSQSEQRKADVDSSLDNSVNNNDLLKDVDPGVQQVVKTLASQVIQQELERRDTEAKRSEANEKFEQRLKGLEEKFPGGNGLPKFDRNEIIMAIQDPDNEVFDPETKFKELYRDDFEDYLIKSALKKNKSGPSSESTGSGNRKPESNAPPKTFEQAKKSALTRFLRSDD